MAGVLVVGLLALAGMGLRAGDPFGGRLRAARWQAVFLTDGRVFFGHLHAVSDTFFELRDAFFVQVVPATKGRPASRQVLPFTQQLEGPEDHVLLSRAIVAQVEDLRPDADAVKAIEEAGR